MRHLRPCPARRARLEIGFREGDAEFVRGSVGGLGLILLPVKVAAIVLLLLWVGAFVVFNPVEVTCLVVGFFSVLAARFLPDGPPTAVD